MRSTVIWSRICRPASIGLGLKLLQLSYILYSNYDLRKVLHSHIQEIVRETDETVYLGVSSEGEMLYLDAVFPISHAAIRNIVGIKAPLYCTVIGKRCWRL